MQTRFANLDTFERMITTNLVFSIANAAELIGVHRLNDPQRSVHHTAWNITTHALHVLPVSDAVAGCWMVGDWLGAREHARRASLEALLEFEQEAGMKRAGGAA